MKKLLSLFCLFSLLTAFTCEDEPIDFDAENNQTNLEILGEWDLVEFTAEVGSSTTVGGFQIASDIEIYSTTVDYIVNFSESDFATNGSYSYVADIVVNGNESQGEPYTLENVSGSGGYAVNGNEMTIDGSFFEFTFEGVDDTSFFDDEQTVTFQLSNNGQTLTFSQNETNTLSDDITGSVTTSTTVSSSVWTRL